MDQTKKNRLSHLLEKASGFSKENIDDVLHLLVEAVNFILPGKRCRIYLEDLTRGNLLCYSATGPLEEMVKKHAFPINSLDFSVSRVYQKGIEDEIPDTEEKIREEARNLAEKFSIKATCLLPLLHRGQAIGVLCIDSTRKGWSPGTPEKNALKNFLVGIVPVIDQARKYHQQMILARQLDEDKKGQAAHYMMESAVRLIDKLALASVLIPSPQVDNPEKEGLQVLSYFSEDDIAKKLYEKVHIVSLEPGASLLSRYINSSGIITDDSFLEPRYFSDLSSETLQKRYLTEQVGLKSLYVVPFHDPQTTRVICIVNYYTRETHQFSLFEKGILEAHAEMANRVIVEIGSEHMEIKVLSEINELLQERFEGFQPFLTQVLSKATELIGADTGSIAICREIEGEPWLIVENADGDMIGAKSKEWRKAYIPPLRVGGTELPPEERSLTGYVAKSGKPYRIRHIMEEMKGNGLYREITSTIKSEIAVPVVCDEEVIAVICLDSLSPNFFTDEHERLLEIIARLISRHLSDLQQIEKLTSEVKRLSSDVDYKDPNISSYKLGNIIGRSQKSTEVVNFIEKITPSLYNRITFWESKDHGEGILGLPSILISGDTGCGKEFIFNNIFSRLNDMYRKKHFNKELPVKKTNIAAYSGELTYSELFGHKRGAFTGAHADRKGILEEANGGVVFLDEIGDADPKTQVQLLRFLDNGGFVRLGENITRYARVLLVAATNKNLIQLIREKKFREDLYYRLSELALEVPSLNERREDIPDLAVHFLGKLHQIYRDPKESGENVPSLSKDARQVLSNHHYSGNIRELRSILLRALFFRQGSVLSGKDIEKVLKAMRPRQEEPEDELLSNQVARKVFEEIRNGEADFWQSVHEPFTDNKISRNVVLKIIQEARNQGAHSMPRLAEALHACNPFSDLKEDKKAFLKFKNFLYKTIKVTQV
jgi:transcriptional regulator with GAF, ATPase, and Fis domain